MGIASTGFNINHISITNPWWSWTKSHSLRQGQLELSQVEKGKDFLCGWICESWRFGGIERGRGRSDVWYCMTCMYELKPTNLWDCHIEGQGGTGLYNCKIVTSSGWWFQRLFVYTPTWGNDPIWRSFFKWVETTNYRHVLERCQRSTLLPNVTPRNRSLTFEAIE